MSGVATIPCPAPRMMTARTAVVGGLVTSMLAAADWHLTNQEVGVLSIVAGVVSAVAMKAFDAFSKKGGDAGLSRYERRRLERQDREIETLRHQLDRERRKDRP